MVGDVNDAGGRRREEEVVDQASREREEVFCFSGSVLTSDIPRERKRERERREERESSKNKQIGKPKIWSQIKTTLF